MVWWDGIGSSETQLGFLFSDELRVVKVVLWIICSRSYANHGMLYPRDGSHYITSLTMLHNFE